MREIVYRGKTKVISASPYNNGKEDGEWVQGFYYDDVGCSKIKQFELSHADYISYEIDPDTRGQYIGRKDKNGNRIFEGDIIKGKAHTYLGYRVKIGVVKYFDTGFIMDIDPNNNNNLDYKNIPNDCKIIGNIYDNPELIKDI